MIIPYQIPDNLLVKRISQEEQEQERLLQEQDKLNYLRQQIANQRDMCIRVVQNIDEEFRYIPINTESVVSSINFLEYILHNSFANLRVGDFRINSSIGKKLDPLKNEYFLSENENEKVITVDAGYNEQQLFAKQMHKYMRLISNNPNLQAEGFKLVKNSRGETCVYSSNESLNLNKAPSVDGKIVIRHFKKMADNSTIAVTHYAAQSRNIISNIESQYTENLSHPEVLTAIFNLVKEKTHNDIISLFQTMCSNEVYIKNIYQELDNFFLEEKGIINGYLIPCFNQVLTNNIENRTYPYHEIVEKTTNVVVEKLMNDIVVSTKNVDVPIDISQCDTNLKNAIFKNCIDELLSKGICNDQKAAWLYGEVASLDIQSLVHEKLHVDINEGKGISIFALQGIIYDVAEELMSDLEKYEFDVGE